MQRFAVHARKKGNRENNQRSYHIMIKAILVAFLVFVDQISKLAVLKRLHQDDSVPVLPGVFHLTLVYNSGSAFGFLRNRNWILAYITLLAIIIILFLLVRRPHFKSNLYLRLWQGALILILCGASGNLIDRIRFGYVVDFLDFRVWPVFNFADAMISCGVFLLLFLLIKKKAIE